MSGRAAVWAWVAAVLGLSPAFYVFDWGQGPVRTGLLLAWLGCGLGLLRWAERGAGAASGAVEPSARLRRALWALAALAFAVHLYAGVREIERTARTNAITLDQGQIAYRAIHWFGELNPYGRSVMLDPVYYLIELKQHAASGCLTVAAPARLLDAQRRFWDGLELDAMAELMPTIDGAEHCARARLGFASLGFKYGPLDLAAYVPAVLLFGQPGVFVTQLAAFCVLVLVVAALAGQRAGRSSMAVPLALCALLLTPHLYNNVLTTSALDVVPTLLALCALWAHGAQRATLAALLLGAALASKPLPGLLYAPLLFAFPLRSALVAAAAALVPYVPFALWDAEGLLNNVLLYPLTRPTDSTALVHSLPGGVRVAWVAACAFGVLAAIARVRRAGATPPALGRCLFATHMLVLAASGYLHNNYLTWLAPVLALWAVELWCAGSQTRSRRSDPIAG